MISILRTLFGKENTEKKIVWGIRADREMKNYYQVAASLLGVTVNRLVAFVLMSWMKDNIEVFRERKALRALGALVADYDGIKSAPKPLPGSWKQRPAKDDLINLSTTWSIREVNMETRLRIKALAFNRGVPINKVLDELVAREWKQAEKEPFRPGISRRLRREVHRVLLKCSAPKLRKRFNKEEVR